MILNKTNYVDLAEKAINEMLNRRDKYGKKYPKLTTTKIRKILSMSADIYNDVKRTTSEKIDEEMRGRLQYLRMHIVYEAGRDGAVKNLVETARLLECIQEIGSSREQLIVFCHYMEALVAYHRFLGGRDN